MVFVTVMTFLESGATVIAALNVLKDHGVNETNVIIVTLFSTPHGALNCLKKFPKVTVLTSELHDISPSHFGLKYFGADAS